MGGLSLDWLTVAQAAARRSPAPGQRRGSAPAGALHSEAMGAEQATEATGERKAIPATGTSPLLMYIDTITGFPLATNGGNVVIQWDNGAYKIVSL